MWISCFVQKSDQKYEYVIDVNLWISEKNNVLWILWRKNEAQTRLKTKPDHRGINGCRFILNNDYSISPEENKKLFLGAPSKILLGKWDTLEELMKTDDISKATKELNEIKDSINKVLNRTTLLTKAYELGNYDFVKLLIEE